TRRCAAEPRRRSRPGGRRRAADRRAADRGGGCRDELGGLDAPRRGAARRRSAGRGPNHSRSLVSRLPDGAARAGEGSRPGADTRGGAAVSDAAPKHVVVGTAGHIDHGKTSLVKALTRIYT